MASKKTGIRKAAGKAARSSEAGLGGALLSIVAIGFTFGAALIGAAKALGEAIEEKQAYDLQRLEEKREAEMEEVRRIVEAESFVDWE